MYNMYSWDQAARTADEHADTQPTENHAARNGQAHPTRNGQARPAHNGPARNAPAHNGPARNGSAHNGQAAPRHASAATRHAQAVQFSLDRRDNGGDAGRTG